jgi:hypothetical protein
VQVEAKDAFLGGDIRVHSKEQELSYTKRIDINGATMLVATSALRRLDIASPRRCDGGAVGRVQLCHAHVRSAAPISADEALTPAAAAQAVRRFLGGGDSRRVVFVWQQRAVHQPQLPSRFP